jgi:CTD small phosphatase-like protein 2
MGEEVSVADLAQEEPRDEEVEEYMEFDPYAFIKSLPPLEQCAPTWRRALLPKQTRNCKRKTLVLDLDETLVHSTLDQSNSHDFAFEVSLNNTTHSVNVKQRPHMAHFLTRCAQLFEVVIFTASQKLYAEQLLNVIDPGRKLIRHRIFRDSCLFVDGNYMKDLTVLGRDMALTLIVDNSPQAFGFQVENGVPIESWYDDEDDQELLKMLPFLESLVDVEDVRPLILKEFKLQQKVDEAPTYIY